MFFRLKNTSLYSYLIGSVIILYFVNLSDLLSLDIIKQTIFSALLIFLNLVLVFTRVRFENEVLYYQVGAFSVWKEKFNSNFKIELSEDYVKVYKPDGEVYWDSRKNFRVI